MLLLVPTEFLQPNSCPLTTPLMPLSLTHPITIIISYAALSDFFYVWLKRSIGHLYPTLSGSQELISTTSDEKSVLSKLLQNWKSIIGEYGLFKQIMVTK
jgi:hypothetical protein